MPHAELLPKRAESPAGKCRVAPPASPGSDFLCSFVTLRSNLLSLPASVCRLGGVSFLLLEFRLLGQGPGGCASLGRAAWCLRVTGFSGPAGVNEPPLMLQPRGPHLTHPGPPLTLSGVLPAEQRAVRGYWACTAWGTLEVSLNGAGALS